MATPSRGLRSSHQGILGELKGARKLASGPGCAVRADSVSHWGVQQHLDHLELTDRAVLDALSSFLAGKAPAGPVGQPTLMGRFVLVTGFIPRGKGRAPERVQPEDRSAAEIVEGFEDLLSGYQRLGADLGRLQEGGATQRHPILGVFNGVHWLRFVQLHHHHHNKIIRDILKIGA
jgi:hypothetical protein